VRTERATDAAGLRRTRRPHTLEHLPRPLALTLRLDAARRALAARALFAGLQAVRFGGVAARRCGSAVECGNLAAGHGSPDRYVVD
jgi:hypothetical protein